jgi:hypothetical protein
MKKLFSTLFFLATAALLGNTTCLAGADLPKAKPKEIWKYITETAPYQEWKQWPDHKGMQKGRAPHGPKHKVFVNDIALQDKEKPMDYGSLIVKENYSSDEKMQAITIMFKVKGYNRGMYDWYFAKFTPEGRPGPFGDSAMGCFGCHSVRAGNDFIYVHKIK